MRKIMSPTRTLRKVLIVTGEVSGDLHGGYLLKALKRAQPNLEAIAVGGDHLREAGATILADVTRRATIGFIETLKHIPALLLLKNTLSSLLSSGTIDALICIDYQGFNMLLAEMAKKKGVRVIYYIPPQEWVWGSEKGMRKVASVTDQIITIFRQEYEHYQVFSENVSFFGHPLVDMIKESLKQQHAPHTVTPKRISVFPGSREQEIRHVFPVMVETMNELIRLDRLITFEINLPNTHYLNQIKRMLSKCRISVPIQIGKTYEVLGNSEFAMLTSGTICLEAAIIGVPHVVLYRFSRLSYPLMKRVMDKKFKYPWFSLTNIVAGKLIVREFLQDFTATELSVYIHQLISDPKALTGIRQNLASVKMQLQADGRSDIIDQIAKSILAQK